MAYTELSDINASQGFAQLFVYVNDVTSGLFSKLLLFALFVVISIGTYMSSRRINGHGSFSASAAVSGFVVAISSILMLSIDGLISLTTVIICIILEIGFVAWFFLSGDSD